MRIHRSGSTPAVSMVLSPWPRECRSRSTETIVESKSRTVVIGPDRPFVIIGERINPTGRKQLAAEMAAGDFSRVEADALAQVDPGQGDHAGGAGWQASSTSLRSGWRRSPQAPSR